VRGIGGTVVVSHRWPPLKAIDGQERVGVDSTGAFRLIKLKYRPRVFTRTKVTLQSGYVNAPIKSFNKLGESPVVNPWLKNVPYP
jgi:hypothetical protein